MLNIVFQLYNQGMSAEEISAELGWDIETVDNHLNYKFNTYTYVELFSDKEIQNIVEKYNNGISTVKLGKLYYTNRKKIGKIIDKYSKKNHLSVRKYSLDETYWDNIDTPNKAYHLGFMYADGCNMPSKGTLSLILEECDREILEKLKRELHSAKPLVYEDCQHKNTETMHFENLYKLIYFSSHMCEAIAEKGVVPAKSNIIRFPNWLPEEYISHFVRGYFDGNGSMGIHDVSKLYNHNLRISFVSTKWFCNSLKNILETKLNISCQIRESRNLNGITHDLIICKQADIKIFLDWLYDDAELYLKRKHDIYIQKYNINESLAI